MVKKYKVGIQIPDQSGIWMVPGLLIEWYQLPANRGPNSTSVNKANIARLSPKPRHYFKDCHRNIEICPNFLLTYFLFPIYWNKLNDQNQVFLYLYAIWPKSRDLYSTYLKSTKPPSVWDIHLVTNKTIKAVTWIARLAYIWISAWYSDHRT